MTRAARFTEDTARRVLKQTARAERSGRDMGPTRLPRAPGGDGEGGYVGRFAGSWDKGETKTITAWTKASGTWTETAQTFDVENLAADIWTPDSESPGWLGFSFRGGAYLLDWFECGVQEAGS